MLAQNPKMERYEVEFESQLKSGQDFNCKITLHCRYQVICAEILDCLNQREMDVLSQNTQFGDLIRCGNDFNISSQIIWYMVIRQSNLRDSQEFWMVINGRPLRFSKIEFALLTGLRFAANKPCFPESDEFKNKHFIGKASVMTKDILGRMHLLKKRKKNSGSVSMSLVQLAALYFATGVLCPSWHMSDPVDNKILNLASTWETFRSFPWGNMAYDILLRNLKKDMRAKEEKIRSGAASYTHNIGGFVHPFQVLAYECIPGIARKYAEKRVGQGLPLARMCRWSLCKWNQKNCPKYNSIREAAKESDDIISCLTPTEEESAAVYIRDGEFEDECSDPVTEHISQMLSKGMKVFCTTKSSSPSHPNPPSSPFRPSPSPSPSHPYTSRPSTPLSPSRISSSPTSQSFPTTPPHPLHKETHSSTSTDLRKLCKYIDLKFESVDSRFAKLTTELARLDGNKIQTVCDYVTKEQKKAKKLLKRPIKAHDEVVKRRRKFIDTYEEEDEDVVESSHMENKQEVDSGNGHIASLNPKLDTRNNLGSRVGVSTSVKERALEVQKNLSLPFPCFLKCMLASHVNGRFWLDLPKQFSDLHLPKHDATVILVDEDDKEYAVTYLVNKNEFSGGWRRFSIAHKLLAGDALVFQLIEFCKFKIYIVRATNFTEVSGAIDLLNLDVKNKAIDTIMISRKMEDQAEYNSQSFVTAMQKYPKTLAVDNAQEKNTELLISDDETAANLSDDDSDYLGSKGVEGIRFSESVVNFEDVKDFADFSIQVNGLVLDSEIPTHLRTKYYHLCCSQKKFLHVNLINGLNSKLAAGIISEIIYIADGIKSAKLTATSCHHLETWDRTLKSFEDLGMTVGFLRGWIHKLATLSSGFQVSIELKKRERNETKAKMKDLEAKLLNVKALDKILDTEVNDLEVKYEEQLGLFFKEIGGVSW